MSGKIDSFDATRMSVQFAWPSSITGVERIFLTANGHLQRMLSAFFAQSIDVALVHSHTYAESEAGTSTPCDLSTTPLPVASSVAPPKQHRKVRLLCGNTVICVATSSVRTTAPQPAELLLKQKYAIGQVFRELGAIPEFELFEVGMDGLGGPGSLWRKYKLFTDGFECNILEVFTSREMFVRGEAWLKDEHYGHEA